MCVRKIGPPLALILIDDGAWPESLYWVPDRVLDPEGPSGPPPQQRSIGQPEDSPVSARNQAGSKGTPVVDVVTLSTVRAQKMPAAFQETIMLPPLGTLGSPEAVSMIARSMRERASPRSRSTAR
jgi:hypothetical protein